MKKVFLSMCLCVLSFAVFANNGNPSLITAANQEASIFVENGNKFITVTTTYTDGTTETFLTNVAISQLRKLRTATTIPAPTKDITWDEDQTTVGDQLSFDSKFSIEAAFTNAFRAEETLTGIGSNALGDLELPNDFDSYDANLQTLVLLNSVRNAYIEAGLLSGLTLEAVEAVTVEKAEDKTSNMIANNNFSSLENGKNCMDQLYASLGMTDLDHLSNNENLAVYTTNGANVKMKHVRSIYNWIFMDKGCGFVHRNSLLSPSKSTFSGQGYDDNYGKIGAEGFVGISVKDANNYNPLNFEMMSTTSVIALNLVDPAADAVIFNILSEDIFNNNMLEDFQFDQDILTEIDTEELLEADEEH